MRLKALLIVAWLVLAGCQAPPSPTGTPPPTGAEEVGSSVQQPTRSVDGWTVRVSLQPDTVGPITIEIGGLRDAPESNARPWIQHDLVFRNQGDRPVIFEDTRRSLFLRREGRPILLVADRGCGYEKLPKRVRPGVCLLYLDEFTIRPAATVRRDVTLYKDLRGMELLSPGTYVWHKVIGFRVGKADAPVRKATIRLTYEVSPGD